MNITSQLKMNSLEIATLLDKRHDNVKRAIDSLTTQGIISYPQIEGVSQQDSMMRSYTTKAYVFEGAKGKRDSIVVVAQLSPEFTARLVDRWQELENTVAKISHNTPQGVEDIMMINVIADSLRVADSSKLGMIKTYCAKNAPRLLPCLPQYAVDTFKEGGASSEATLPLTSLLDGTGISTVKANAILLKEGILEELARPSSKGGLKKFKSVTAKGLDYGKNMTSPINPRETQPHWYVNKKQELLAIITKNS